MTNEAERPRKGIDAQLARLEEIVAALEDGELELDDALRLFEEGVGTLREAQRTVRDAELRIDRLLETGDGAVEVEAVPRVEAR